MHGPPVAQAASGGAPRRVFGGTPKHGATSREGLAEGESDGYGVRQTRRTTYGGVNRGSREIGIFKTLFPRFERLGLGSKKEHFGEAKLRRLGSILE